ncbi:MAG: PQQ-binding-like beta-propeller repeat protein [Acidimicrobiales bacterium]
MGKRCRTAAWGATFALLVAACAATEAPRTAPTGRSAAADAPRSDTVQFPRALANASFVQAELVDGPCVSGDDSQVSLYDAATGERIFSYTSPRPGGLTVVHGTRAYIGFAWDRGQPPGVGALDLRDEAPVWQRFLDEQPEQIKVSGDNLVIVSRAGIQALDAETGDDVWKTSTEFDLSEVVLAETEAYGINAIGVYGFDLETGAMMWELPIDRPDELVASGDLLAVAAGPTLKMVDVAAQALLWEQDVNRLGAGSMWVSTDAVIVELAPSANPAGAIAALDRASGRERWQVERVGDIHWTGPDQLVTTVSAAERRPGFPHDLIGVHTTTGEIIWSMPITDDANVIAGSADQRVLLSDPHPAAPGLHRVQLLDSSSGSPVWSTVRDVEIDGASIDGGALVSIHRSTPTLRGDRGEVGMLLGPERAWAATEADGISHEPILTPYGLLVVSGEPSATCVGRELFEPSGGDDLAALLDGEDES